MPLPEENTPLQPHRNSLEDLENRLYSRTPPPLRHDEEFMGEEKHIRIAPGWTSETERKESALYSIFSTVMPWLKRLFIASILFFLFAGGLAVFSFWRKGSTLSPQNISIEIFGPVGAAAGEELPIEIVVRNDNQQSLHSVDLLVELPDGTKKPDNLSESLLRYRDTLREMAPGASASRRISLVPFGQEGERKSLSVTAEYRPKDSNAIFSKKTKYEFAISSSPVVMKLGIPKEVNSNQVFETVIDLSSNAGATQDNLLLKAQYPFGFEFLESTPAPAFGKDGWLLGDLEPKGRRSIRIKGKIIATEESDRTFTFMAGTQNPKDEKQISTTFLKETPTVSVRRPFLTLDLLVNGEKGKTFIGRSGQTARVDILWGNNLSTKIADLVITATLRGDIYNTKSVTSGSGFYDSNTGTVVWDKEKTARFSAVAPGESGTLSFSFGTLSVATNPAAFKNPGMSIEVSAQGKRLDEQGLYQAVISSVTKEIKVATTLTLTSRLLHSEGPLQNSGSVPPQAEQETSYTVVWSLSNSSNGVSGASVSAVLPSYMKWTGKVSPDSEQVTYKSVGGEITWNVGDIESGTGVGSAPREVAFQVSFLPSLGQVGTAPTVLGESIARGTDLFAGLSITSNQRPALTTKSLGDVGATGERGIVVK